jgi:hypothetical protein
MPAKITINRAPVLTLWAAVVGQRLGYTWQEALSLGKAVAGLNAQAKGRRLGVFKPQEKKTKAAREKARGEEFSIELCGRPVPAKNVDKGVRAVIGRTVVDSESARRYLETKFGDNLEAARSAMTALAKAYKPKELSIEAFGLYEQFRPDVPAGTKGWGAKGVLDLRKILAMAKRQS